MDESLVLLSLVISTSIFLSIILFGKIGPLVAVTTLSVTSVLWGWVAPTENEMFVLRVILLLVSSIVIYFNREKLYANIRSNLYTKIYEIFIANALIISTALIVRSVQPKFLYELMFNGYDNYGHLAVFYRTFELNGFEYSPRAQIETPNVLAADGYPLLVHMVWSVFLRLFNFDLESSESLIQFFVYFSILTLQYLSYLVVLLVTTQFKKLVKYKLYAITLLVLGLILFAQTSTLVLQGFSPTLAGLIFTFSVYVLIRLDITPRLKWILLYASVILTGYSYQLFVPIAYLGILAFSYLEFKKTPRGKFYSRLLISHLGLFLAAVPLISVSKTIPSYLFAYGGIQAPHMILLLAVLIFNLGLLILRKWDLTSLGYFFSTALAASLIAWAKFNDVGYYYAIKIVYLSLLLGIVAGLLNFCTIKRFRGFNVTLSSLTVITIASLLLANQTSVFQNSTAIQILTSKGFENPCVGSQYDAVTLENVFGESTVIFVYANAGSISDLGTRQMNAINGRWDNEIFNFSIPYGQAENQEQFFDSYRLSNPNTDFLVYDYSQKNCGLVKRG